MRISIYLVSLLWGISEEYMIPRRHVYIGWSDLLFSLMYCLWPTNRAWLERRVELDWSPNADSIVCLSVRSGFDLLLQALNLPCGSEILVSALTIPEIPGIIEQHGLVPVPVDLDMQALEVKAESVEQALTDKTRAIVVAHLFGSRMPLDNILRIARQRGLYVIEDCAQVYIGNHYHGHPESDVSMFSFDPAKTNTALGGALLRVKDPALLHEVRRRQASYPIQPRWRFALLLARNAIVKLLYHPLVYGLFCWLYRRRGASHEHLMVWNSGTQTAVVDGYRQQPAVPLLALLGHRLKRFDPLLIEQRIRLARTALTLMPSIRCPGTRVADHSYWVFPICVECPEQLQQYLWHRGFEASRVTTHIGTVEPPRDRAELQPLEAQQAIEQILYLPVYPGISARDLQRLAAAISAFDW